MTKEQREAYRPALEAWLDGELEFAKDGKDFEPWHSVFPPICNYPPDHYRRRRKPMVFYMRLDGVIAVGASVQAFSTENDITRIGHRAIWRCEEVME